MIANPLVSIIVPTYNRRRWIGECLDSILAQTYPHIETLVIDDCSSDGTAEWLTSDPKYAFARVHVQPQNGGASEARNTGIRIAKGDLIAFIDSDDLLGAHHVETAVKIFQQRPNVGLFCCDSTMIGVDGEALFNGRTWHEIQSKLKKRPVQTGPRSLRDIFLFSNIFPGFTLPKAVFDKVGNFNQTIFPMDDYELMLRVAESGYEVYYLHEPLAFRREHASQCSGVANSVDTCVKQLRTLRESLARNPELLATDSEIRQRLAQAKFELAVSRIKAGERASGLGALLQTVATHPSQLVQAARLGGRRLQRLVASI